VVAQEPVGAQVAVKSLDVDAVEVAEALRPVCYFIFYWTGIITSPEAVVAGAVLLSALLLVLASLVRRFSGGASSGSP